MDILVIASITLLLAGAIMSIFSLEDDLVLVVMTIAFLLLGIVGLLLAVGLEVYYSF